MGLTLVPGQLHGPGQGPPTPPRLSDAPKLLRGKHEGYILIGYSSIDAGKRRKEEGLIWSVAMSSGEERQVVGLEGPTRQARSSDDRPGSRKGSVDWFGLE